MGLDLKKDDVQQLDSGLTQIQIGLGWKPRDKAADLDASCLMLGKNGKVRSDADVIFYNQPESPCGSVQHMGDDLIGGSGADDEQIVVDLTKVPNDVAKLLFVVTIYNANGLNFGQVDDAYIRLVDLTTDEEVLRFELSEDACLEETVLFGELTKENGVWNFHALGQAYPGDLGKLLVAYGANVN
ncbi:MAG: TerD family protein [Thermoguttaceae bacterium]|nr:TerD family protein [Thermoguttaceae bacterium]MBQ9798419.1 TerD family protein [Thermoguttaceae bacterium]